MPGKKKPCLLTAFSPFDPGGGCFSPALFLSRRRLPLPEEAADHWPSLHCPLLPLDVSETGRGLDGLVPGPGVSAVAHTKGYILGAAPPDIVPVKVLAGLAGLFLLFHGYHLLQQQDII